MTAAAMVRVRGLAIGWGEVTLLRDVSFDVRRGDVFAVLGGSGCGKSTLLRNVIGLEEPQAGEVDVGGRGRPNLAVGRPAFGVMFQAGALFGSMTVVENVALPLRQWSDLPEPAVMAVARATLGLVGLKGAEAKYPSEISGGMKKRAAIARALVLEPELIFLDEPSAGLDPVSADALDELILALNAGLGLTVVLVTHELPSIFKIVKRCIMLDKEAKGVIAEGDPRELRDESDDPRVRRFFHRKADEGGAS
ncbi:MAG TPA: ATP-binding cassette domain-containing protein [Polyangiaceae bacterium]|nr:ATP-binding cassette domain-containing protein [Polyangiaceae bacterium]